MGAPVPPISIEPSGKSLGIDGSWYTFNVNIGTPAQTVEVLPSTLIAESMVVDVHGCADSAFSNCSTIRGGLFDNSSSTSWQPIESGQLFSLSIDGDLGISSDDGGYWGYDTVSLTKADGSSLTVNNQVVSHYLTSDFFVGMIGLSRKASDIKDNSQPSYLTAVYNNKQIPSLSYSYHAGASYRQSPPDLTLGGQDLSRFHPNAINFTMAPSGDRDLITGVQAITLGASNGTTNLLSGGIDMFIDTTQPYLWLPSDACAAFSLAFGLQKDEITSRYTVDKDQHEENLSNNATLTFTLGNMVSGGDTVDIVFPYAAFDLNYTQTDVTTPKTTFMFPIREQDNSQAYTIGRAFFQEAYLSVNYEFSNFSIFQAIPQTGTPQPHVVALPSADGQATQGGNNPSGSTVSTGGSGLSGGAVAGIIVGVLLLLGGAILAFICLRRRKRHQEKPKGGIVRTYSEAPEGPLPPELDQRNEMGEVKPDYYGAYLPKKNERFQQKPYDGPVMSSDSSARGELESNPPYSPTMSALPDVATAYHETAQELAAPTQRFELPTTRTTSHRASSRLSQGPSAALEPATGNGSSSAADAVSRDGDNWAGGSRLEEASLHSQGRPSMMSADSIIILQPGSPTVVHTNSRSRVVSSNIDGSQLHEDDTAGRASLDNSILRATSHAYGTDVAEPLSPTNPMLPLVERSNRSQDTLVGSHGEGGGRDSPRDSRHVAPETPIDDFVRNSPEHASLGYGRGWDRPR